MYTRASTSLPPSTGERPSMRILISGATGYLGRYLAAAFAHAGHQVVALVRRPGLDDALSHHVAHTLVLDTAPLAELLSSAGVLDAVVHTATSYGRAGEDVPEICRVNTVFALDLLDAAVKCRVPLFVNTDTALPSSANPYALSKKHFRDWGEYFAAHHDFAFINLEVEYFFGPGDGDGKFITHVVRSCLANVPELPLTPGEQLRDFIYIDDVVAAYMLLLSRSSDLSIGFHEFSVGLGEAWRLRDIVELICELCGSTTRPHFGALPYRPNEVMRSVANPGQLASLGWTPRFSLREGLARTIEQEKVV